VRGASRSGSFVKLSNSPAITRVPRLELGLFESQPESPRINQRPPGFETGALLNFDAYCGVHGGIY